MEPEDALLLEWSAGNIATVYYQGLYCSQTQLSKYTGKKGFIGTTGERVFCTKGADIIKNPFIGCEIGEVRLRNMKEWNFNPVVKVQQLLTGAIHWKFGMVVENSGSHETLSAHSISISDMTVAQETDIASHKKRVDMLPVDTKDQGIILYGASRGAATTFNSLCVHKYSNVKLAIFEGCFYDVDGVFQFRYGFLAKPFYNTLQTFTKHKGEGHSPGKLVNDYPEGVPSVFLTSKRDKSVPPEGTIRLAKELAARNKNDVYLLELHKSSHSGYMFDDAEDTKKYLSLIHAIYKKYNLPYIELYAANGKELLEKSKL